MLKDIIDGEFRSSPGYELVLFDRLSVSEQLPLADLKKDPELYGVLRPLQAGLGVKSACRNTALLLLTMKEPGRLPGYVHTMLGARCNSVIAELVLDGVLEIRVGPGFVSGKEAHSWLYTEQGKMGEGIIERLSLAALRYAEQLSINDATKLSARMYFYNRRPISPRWKSLLPHEDALAEHLEVHRHGRNRRLLDRYWHSVPPPANNSGWFIFKWRDDHGEESADPSGRLAYKLYVSPDSERLSQALPGILETLAEFKTPRLKFGRDIYGVFRPDKFVAYFHTFEQLSEVSQRMLQRLSGTPAQGVPFTSEVGGEGLLSWGMDPPRVEQILSWQERPSWRLWVTNRLAVALIAARAQGAGGVDPVQFAFDRLRLDGVDTSSWTPVTTGWKAEGSSEVLPWT